MSGRVLIALGALVAVGGSFLPYFSGEGVIPDDGSLLVFDDGLTFWEFSDGADVALLAAGVAAFVLALAGLRGLAAVAVAALAGLTLPQLVDTLRDGAASEGAGVWLMPAGGLVAVAGAVRDLRQRSTSAS